MTTEEEQIRNVLKVFEAFARAVEKNENIKIEYLNDEGESENLTIEINKVYPIFSFDIMGSINIKGSGITVFHKNVNDIHSITTFRTTKLKFHEVNKK